MQMLRASSWAASRSSWTLAHGDVRSLALAPVADETASSAQHTSLGRSASSALATACGEPRPLSPPLSLFRCLSAPPYAPGETPSAVQHASDHSLLATLAAAQAAVERASAGAAKQAEIVARHASAWRADQQTSRHHPPRLRIQRTAAEKAEVEEEARLERRRATAAKEKADAAQVNPEP